MDFQRFQRGVAWVLLAVMIGLFAWAIWGTLNPPRVAMGEMHGLFAGHTIVGHWDGEPYAQYFEPDGGILVAAGDDPPGHGRWWVEDPDLLCVEVPEWDARRCGQVWREGAALMLFEEGSGRSHPATLVRGRLVLDPGEAQSDDAPAE